MMPIGSITTSLSTTSWSDLQHCINHFLDYDATHPDAFICYSTSDTTYWIHTDASYLCESSKAWSRAGGYHYLSDKPTYPIKSTDPLPKHSALSLINSKIIDAVMSSVQRGRNRSQIPQYQRCHSHLQYFTWTWTLSTSYTNSIQQQSSKRNHHWHHHSMQVKIHGHAFLLDLW
jgi:hypothetical protein